MTRPRIAELLFLASFVLGAPEARGESRAERIYRENCAVCHGLKGDGKGPDAGRLRSRPRDFASGIYKFRSTPTGALPLDSDLYRTLSRGIPRTGMIPQTHLSEDDRWLAIEHTKRFSDRFVLENPAEPVTIPPAPADLASLAGEGEKLFRDAGCAVCHGESGRGDGHAAPELKDSWDRPIRASDLTVRPLKSGDRPADLYRTLATGLDGTPMPSYFDALSPRELWALVARIEELGVRAVPTADEDERTGRLIEMRGWP